MKETMEEFMGMDYYAGFCTYHDYPCGFCEAYNEMFAGELRTLNKVMED